MTSRYITTNRFAMATGFSLIELLVVMAIVSILVAILFPVFATAREKARQATCSSNLRQLGLAFIQYEQDYDESFLIGTDNLRSVGWAYDLYPYVKLTAVYVCPDDLSVPTIAQSNSGYSTCSYFVNPWLTGFNASTTPGSPVVANQMIAPSMTVELGECAGGLMATTASDLSPSSDGLVYYNQMTAIATGYTGADEYAALELANPSMHLVYPGRHTGGANWLAFDGHVKWLLGSQVSPGRCWFGPGGELNTWPENTMNRNPAGTSSMTDSTTHTARFILTFSPA